ncbi:MAG: carbon-nitrogen hydrolase family protein [Elusimicrobia bacterium]|nr:carbon-nitrogen hydrolase family protein [Elusimicrobiota bacterium]
MSRLPLSVEPVSLDLAFGDVEANLGRIERALERRLARAKGAARERLFLLPELSLTGFVTKDPPAFRLQPPDAPVLRLSRLAARLGVGLAAGFPETDPRRPGKPFNTLALFGPDGKVVGRYRKLHLFTWGENPEAGSYAAGDSGVVCRYRGWKVGFALCFDVRFPPLFHQYARAGADLLLVAACWIGGPHKRYQYKTINSAHAILSQSYVAAVNRSGRDPFFRYDGAQYVFSPFGEQLYAGKPVRLDEAELAAARRLVVRPSDLPRYPVRTAG